MESDFTVKIRDFEGPLDLILSLIEERKLLISDVSLSRIADDFLAYLAAKERFPVAQAASFILVAASLLLLKSKSLLPIFELSKEEEGDIRDLEWRLKILQEFKAVAKGLAVLTAKGARTFFGPGVRIADPIFSPSPDLSAQSLREAAMRALAAAPAIELAPEVSVRKVVSLEQMMNRLAERIEKAVRLTFRDFTKGGEGRAELVVGFLAVLELAKRGLLAVTQERAFGDIVMDYRGEMRAPKFD